jgi:hypothetical protein
VICGVSAIDPVQRINSYSSEMLDMPVRDGERDTLLATRFSLPMTEGHMHNPILTTSIERRGHFILSGHETF